MAKAESGLFQLTFSEKIDDLRANFGTDAAIVHAYERLYQLCGDKPTEEQLSEAICIVSSEAQRGKFRRQS